MTNSLIKNTVIESRIGLEDVPAIPYRPASPPRTVYETRQVCGFRYPAGYGTYSYTTDSDGQLRMVFTPSVPPATLATLVSTWSCQDVQVPVTYPGTPEQPYVPGYSFALTQMVTGFNLGWNAGGRSIAIFTDDASVEFKARASMVGAIVGMNLYDGIDAGYNGNNIDYGFFLARGIARVIESGVIKAYLGPYTDATVFKITRTGTGIDYLMNGVSVATATGAPTTSGWLEASLYSGNDEIFDPVITQITAPDTTTKGSTLDASLPALTMFAGPSQFAELNASLPALDATMDAGSPLPAYAVMDAQLPPLSFDGNWLTGELATLNSSLPNLSMMAADHPYSELNASLPALTGGFEALEGNLNASMGSIAVASATMAPSKLLVALLTSTATADTDMGAGRVVSAELMSEAMMDATYGVGGVYDAVMLSVARSGAILGVPESDNDTWVVNLDGGGSTRYVGYNFNSFALIGGRYYGAGPTGVFELDGDTDAGEPIRAVISFGKMDFDTPERKTVSEVYLGMSASGNLFVKVKADGSEYLYKTQAYSEELRQQRVKCGKGLNANYLWLEIYNEDGADFELDTVEFHIADRTRRTGK